MVPATQEAPPTFMSSARAVDEFLQLSDYESGDKRNSPIGFGEIEWFGNIDFFHDRMPKGTSTTAEVSELPNSQSGNAAFRKRNRPSNISLKKPRLELSDDEEYLMVPNLG